MKFNERSIVYRANKMFLDTYRKMMSLMPNFDVDDCKEFSEYQRGEALSKELGNTLKKVMANNAIRNTAVVAEAMVKADLLVPASPCKDSFTKVASEAMTHYGEAALHPFNDVFKVLVEKGYCLTSPETKGFKSLAYQTDCFDQFLALEINTELKIVMVKMSSGDVGTMFVQYKDKAFYSYKMRLNNFDNIIKSFEVEAESLLSLLDKSLTCSNGEKPLFYYDLEECSFELMLHNSVLNNAIFSIQTGKTQLKEELCNG